MMKHRHTDFISDVFLLLEAVGCKIHVCKLITVYEI